MNDDPKSTNHTAPEASPEQPESAVGQFASIFTNLMQKSVERMANLQKATLDMLGEQTTDTLKALNQSVPLPPSTPGMFLLDLSAQAVQNLVQTQKNVLDLFVQQTAVGVGAMADRSAPIQGFLSGMTDIAQQFTDSSIAAQKAVLDFAATQNRVLAEAVKAQAGVAGTPAASAAESIQRGVQVLIETQKELIDIATRPIRQAAAKASA